MALHISVHILHKKSFKVLISYKALQTVKHDKHVCRARKAIKSEMKTYLWNVR